MNEASYRNRAEGYKLLSKLLYHSSNWPNQTNDDVLREDRDLIQAHLNNAAYTNNFELVKYTLRDLRADVNACGDVVWTPLVRYKPLAVAAHMGHLELVRFLLEKGTASVSGGEEITSPLRSALKRRFTPLHLAVHGQHTEVVRMLLQHGGPIDSIFPPAGEPDFGSGNAVVNIFADEIDEGDWVRLKWGLTNYPEMQVECTGPLRKGKGGVSHAGVSPHQGQEEGYTCSTVGSVVER
jgi:ankyrin repeat protein